MDTLSYILFIFLILVVLSFVFKVLWYLMPFIIIGMAILYFRNRFFQPKGPQNRPRQDQPSQSRPDVVDVEFTVRDADEDH